MSSHFTIPFFLLVPLFLNAQTPQRYTEDIDKLYAVLQKTPSYKDQIKGDKSAGYEALYRRLRSDSSDAPTGYARFMKFSQLFFPIKDNHLGFHHRPENFLKPAEFTDSVAVKKYRHSKSFITYPRCNLNLDSLEQALLRTDRDRVEGIYYYDRYLKAALFRTIKKDSLVAVVLATEIPNWEKGQIAFFLKEYKPHRFRAIYGHPLYKNFVLYKTERYIHASLSQSYFYQSLSSSVWKKFPDEKDFVNLAHHTPVFQLRWLEPAVQYLRLGDFSTANNAMQESDKFYTTIKDSLTAGRLLVDLRNNGGGGFKASKKFLKLLQDYSRRGKIFVLINNGTYSHAEQFTLALKKMRNTVTLGEPTNGTLAYGNNYGKWEPLPSGDFAVYVTDMRDDGHYLPYEETGVAPDITLAADSDWLEQATDIINKTR